MRTYLVAAAAVIALLSGCTPSEPQPSTSVAPVPSPVASLRPGPSPSPTPTATSSPSQTPTAFPSYPADLPTEDPQVAAILAGWQEYWRVYEKFTGDPFGYTDFTETQHVTTGKEANTILETIGRRRDRRVKTVGPQQFRDVEVGEVRMGPDGLAQVALTYCADSNLRQVIDIDTGEVLPPPPNRTYREMSILKELNPGDWRVAEFTNEPATC